MAEVTQIKWKWRNLIYALGGPEGVIAAFEKRGVSAPGLETVRGWRFRNSVPSRWSPLLILIAMEAGILKSLNQLIEEIR